MIRIWGILRRGDKMAHDCVVELAEGDLDEALDRLCAELDLPRPVVLGKHQGEFARFQRTVFRPDDFVESMPYSRFEVEVLRDRKKKDAAFATSEFD